MATKNPNDIFEDKKFLSEISRIESAQEIRLKFSEIGIDINLSFAKKFLKVKEKMGNVELSEKELDKISGGVKLSSRSRACFLALSMLLPSIENNIQAVWPFKSSESATLTLQERNKAIVEKKVKIREVLGDGFDRIIENLRRSNHHLYQAINIPKEIVTFEIDEEYVRDLPLYKQKLVNDELAAMNERQTRIFLARYNDTIVNALLANPETRELGMCIFQAKGAAIITDSAQQSVMKILQTILPVLATIVGIKFGGDILEHINNFCVAGKNSAKNLHYKLTHKKIEISAYKSIVDKIESRLRNELVGQDKAIDSIIRLITGYFESVLEAKSLGKKFEGGLILYLTGAPGTGKSTTMKIIQEELKLGSCVCRMSDVVEDRGNDAQTAAARLLKPIVIDNGKTKAIETTNLARQINTGFSTLFCFDEVDKMRILDSSLQNRNIRNEKGEIIGGSIDEMLRNFGDTGTINGKDVSGSIVVATSNETPEDLKMLEHSLFNRYKGCNVQYKEFVASDYVKIIERKFESVRDSFKKRYQTDISLDDSVLRHYSKEFEKEKSGGRGVDVLMNDLRYSLASFRENNKKEFKNLNLIAKFDETSNNITFEKC